jgi:hypothetical protein
LAARARPYTERTRLFKLINKQNEALRAAGLAYRSFTDPSLYIKTREKCQFGKNPRKGLYSFS